MWSGMLLKHWMCWTQPLFKGDNLTSISTWTNNSWNVALCLDVCERIFLKLCAILVSLQLDNVVPFSNTMTFTYGHSGISSQKFCYCRSYNGDGWKGVMWVWEILIVLAFALHLWKLIVPRSYFHLAESIFFMNWLSLQKLAVWPCWQPTLLVAPLHKM